MVPLRDLVPWTPLYMTVRTNAPHPNAARLWVLFNTGPEAQRLREKMTKRMDLSYPKQSRAAEVNKLIDESGAKVVRWLENDESFKKMQWLMTTKKGRDYQKNSNQHSVRVADDSILWKGSVLSLQANIRISQLA